MQVCLALTVLRLGVYHPAPTYTLFYVWVNHPAPTYVWVGCGCMSVQCRRRDAMEMFGCGARVCVWARANDEVIEKASKRAL